MWCMAMVRERGGNMSICWAQRNGENVLIDLRGDKGSLWGARKPLMGSTGWCLKSQHEMNIKQKTSIQGWSKRDVMKEQWSTKKIATFHPIFLKFFLRYWGSRCLFIWCTISIFCLPKSSKSWHQTQHSCWRTGTIGLLAQPTRKRMWENFFHWRTSQNPYCVVSVLLRAIPHRTRKALLGSLPAEQWGPSWDVPGTDRMNPAPCVLRLSIGHHHFTSWWICQMFNYVQSCLLTCLLGNT